MVPAEIHVLRGWLVSCLRMSWTSVLSSRALARMQRWSDKAAPQYITVCSRFSWKFSFHSVGNNRSATTPRTSSSGSRLPTSPGSMQVITGFFLPKFCTVAIGGHGSVNRGVARQSPLPECRGMRDPTPCDPSAGLVLYEPNVAPCPGRGSGCHRMELYARRGTKTTQRVLTKARRTAILVFERLAGGLYALSVGRLGA